MHDRTTPPNRTDAPNPLRRPAQGVIDQRQQQIDPAGKHRVDPNTRDDDNTRQPGGSREFAVKP